jgi:hypothetical protein
VKSRCAHTGVLVLDKVQQALSTLIDPTFAQQSAG